MTRDEAVDIIMKRLGNRTDTSLRDDIIAEMVVTQATLLEGGPWLPWFLIKQDTLSLSADAYSVALPTDFLQEWEDGGLYHFDASASSGSNPWTLLIRDDWDVIENTYANTTTGKPTHYDIVGNNILVAPTADVAYTLYYRYFGADDTLEGTYGDANNVENEWLKYAQDWFMGEVGVVIAGQYLQSDTMLKIFSVQAQIGRNRVRALDISRAESNKRRAMGDD